MSARNIWGREKDEEASKLFKLAVDSMNVCNQKIKTMKTTRVLIQDNMNREQFEMWDSQYIARRPLQLRILDDEMVSIF